METRKEIVAAFDFDGTITTRDSLLPFLLFSTPKSKALWKLFKLTPTYLGYLVNLVSRQSTKERTLTSFFGGMPAEDLRELGVAFAHSQELTRLVTPEAKKRILWHRNQGHRCILVSASIDLYLEPWRHMMGFDDLICSKLEVSPAGIVTGKLEGYNCWGPEKASRLHELMGDRDKYQLYAYGDSRGDQELLALADFAFYREMP